jgi:acyl-CoA synthetase (NDP forming)
LNSEDRGDLRAFFEPAAVAAVGSLRETPGTAYWIIRNIRQFGFSGPVYPVNPNPSNYGEVFGSRVYGSVEEIEQPVDLAAVITPPSTIPDIVEQCARKAVKGVIVMSEGFAESGEDGVRLQQRLRDIGRRTGTRIMGPNTYGVANSANGLVTTPPFTDIRSIPRGGIAICSQTGSSGPHQVPLDDWAYPVSKMCDLGNKCDVDETDVLNYLADDPETRVVAMHLEDVRDGAGFMEAARRLVARKPLVVLKTGRSDAGARASVSHTGSLMGSDRITDAALRQIGAIRVRTWQELWEVPKTLYYQPLPAGNRFAIVTITGGQGVIAADAAADAGLDFASFTPATERKLQTLFPRLGGNPVDIGPVMSDSRSQSSSNPFSAMEQTVPLVLSDANVDCATFTFCAGEQLIPLYPMVVDMFDRLISGVPKAANVWIYGTSLSAMEELARQLQARGLPAYLDLDIAVRSLGYAAYYAKVRSSPEEESRGSQEALTRMKRTPMEVS